MHGEDCCGGCYTPGFPRSDGRYTCAMPIAIAIESPVQFIDEVDNTRTGLTKAVVELNMMYSPAVKYINVSILPSSTNAIEAVIEACADVNTIKVVLDWRTSKLIRRSERGEAGGGLYYRRPFLQKLKVLGVV